MSQDKEMLDELAVACNLANGAKIIVSHHQLTRLIELARRGMEAEASHQPFPNCSFVLCDLPGQCEAEGRCHHPRAEGDKP